MNFLRIVFFGSFQQYSVQVLEKLTEHFSVIAVVTTPPRPAGRHMKLIPTEVQQYAESNTIPVYPLESLEHIPKDIERPDFIVVAGYGKLIPTDWLHFPKIMSINVHQSLLPYYRGAFPAEWAILRGEKETGVTILKMSPEFDKGELLIQKTIPIENADTRESLYKKLYDVGAQLLIENLPNIASGKIVPKPQPVGNYFYARRITREDGFVPWNEFREALNNNPQSLDVKFRAMSGWPGVWTRLPSLRPPATTSSDQVGRGSGVSGQGATPQGKRVKLIALKPEVIVQLEGKQPVSFSQFSSAYL